MRNSGKREDVTNYQQENMLSAYLERFSACNGGGQALIWGDFLRWKSHHQILPPVHAASFWPRVDGSYYILSIFRCGPLLTPSVFFFGRCGQLDVTVSPYILPGFLYSLQAAWNKPHSKLDALLLRTPTEQSGPVMTESMKNRCSCHHFFRGSRFFETIFI